MKFKGSTIHLSHDDLEQAVQYWLDGTVLGYEFKKQQTASLRITRGGNCIINFVDKPKPPVVIAKELRKELEKLPI